MNLPDRIATILRTQPIDQTLTVYGWLRTRRDAKGNFSFLEINDGSCLKNLQVIAGADNLPNYHQLIKKLSTGCSVKISGLIIASPAKGQEIELQANSLEILGEAPPESYPLQKKRHSFEFLRSIPHLRPRTNSLAAVMRIRNKLSFAVHQFFQERDFFYIHTPVITTSDCEGAGEMFTVTSLPCSDGPVDFSKDFFGRHAALTVSGQLEAEVYALAMGNVYTFGPTFRAENSNTSRHLAEFWMVEPEMAFCDLEGDMNIAEEFLHYLVTVVMEECADDLELFCRFVDKGLADRLQTISDIEFERLSYSEAINLLEKSKQSFQYPLHWGVDMQSEHERYLTEKICKKPVIVYDYPMKIKPFYMRSNDDDRTVAAMDVLLPGIGEIIGGSQREERYDVLQQRMQKATMNPADYKWYLDLRR